jgi:hypothetical protein
MSEILDAAVCIATLWAIVTMYRTYIANDRRLVDLCCGILKAAGENCLNCPHKKERSDDLQVRDV